jgi:hypothetical protein
MRGILKYKKFKENDKKWTVQFLIALYNNIDSIDSMAKYYLVVIKFWIYSFQVSKIRTTDQEIFHWFYFFWMEI